MDFFGTGTANSVYDKRRHINVIFVELVTYQISINPFLKGQLVHYLQNERIENTASFFCNNVLSSSAYNFLNLLRKRYNISDDDFLSIVGGIAFKYQLIRSPAGYSRKQNIELLIQMLIAKYYMTPQIEEALTSIDSQIIFLAVGMSPAFSKVEIDKLFKLVVEAKNIYRHEGMQQKIEAYVLEQYDDLD